MSKHPSTRYEGKIIGKKKLQDLAMKKDSAIYYDEEAGYYKEDSYIKSMKRNKRRNKDDDY